MRTLVRAGQKAHLVRVDGRGGPLFWVTGPELKHTERFHDISSANAWFESVERGARPQKPRLARSPWRWSHPARAQHAM
jgi:hypothetical protein